MSWSILEGIRSLRLNQQFFKRVSPKLFRERPFSRILGKNLSEILVFSIPSTFSIKLHYQNVWEMPCILCLMCIFYGFYMFFQKKKDSARDNILHFLIKSPYNNEIYRKGIDNFLRNLAIFLFAAKIEKRDVFHEHNLGTESVEITSTQEVESSKDCQLSMKTTHLRLDW